MKGEITALKKELNELQEQIVSLQNALVDKPEYGLGKGDPSVTRWELDQALLKKLKEEAAGIQHTLSVIDEGTYGTCERCGKPIHPDRLAVLPSATRCIECARVGESE